MMGAVLMSATMLITRFQMFAFCRMAKCPQLLLWLALMFSIIFFDCLLLGS